MKYTAFHESRFHGQVNNALISVKRILDTTRNPRLAADYQDHQYDDKYAMASLMTNTALVSTTNVLERLGMTEEHLATMAGWAHNDQKAVTLRFEAIQTCKFVQETEVPFVQGSSTQTVEVERQSSGRFFGKNSEKTTVKNKVTTMIKEFHWKVRIQYKLIAFAGASPDDGDGMVTLQSREASTILVIKGTEKVPFLNVFKHPPIDLDLTWFLQKISASKQIAQFVIDRSDEEKCRTPRRNPQVDEAVGVFRDVCHFAQKLRQFLVIKVEREIIGRNSPVAANPDKDQKQKAKLNTISARILYNPILPFMEEKRQNSTGPARNNSNSSSAPPSSLVGLSATDDEESPLLSLGDMDKFLGEQVRTVEEAIGGLREQYPPEENDENLISTAEARLVLMACHLEQLAYQYEDSVDYMEHMLKKQLMAAVGKEVQPEDFDEFMKFYYQNKLYAAPYAPSPFCFAIRRPGFYPDGILSIERDSGGPLRPLSEPIDTFARRIPAASDGSTPPIRVPLNAATTVELTGDRYLHGWIQHRFMGSGGGQRHYNLAARARQFSCFMVMVGTIAGPDKFEPKDAIILQNKDEVLIPLILEELPTAKEFKDAISSMSPEQQRFAKAFREMQLESSVFGVCVVQLKPQLEDLLGLPPGGLTKEMQLTQDLLSLFIDYQIPSDLLSYDGPPEEPDKAKKIALVKQYTKSVLDVVQGEKDKQLAQEKQKADMARERHAQEHPESDTSYAAEEDEMQSLRGSSGSSGKMVRGEAGMAGQFRAPRQTALPMARMACMSMSSAAESAGGPGFDLADGRGFDFSRGVPPPNGSIPFDGPGFDFSRGVPPSNGLSSPAPCMGRGGALPPNSATGGGAALKPPPRQHLSPQDGDADNESMVALDFTKIPKELDAKFEAHDKDNSLRATIIKTSDNWSRKRQENLLVKLAEHVSMGADEIKSEKNKAFDLLDALTRSGSLPLAYSELHVVVAVTHCFENDVVGSVVEDNINPIEKVEKSSLLIASTVHGVPSPHTLLRNEEHVGRLQGAFPALFDGQA